MGDSSYTPAEGRARDEIDRKLNAAGWNVQSRQRMNLYEGSGQAVREFILKPGHGRVDYLLFVDQRPVGTIEAKPDGTTLTEVEFQSMLYSAGLPDGFASPFERLPFAFESTGTETRFTNGLDPEPRSRRMFFQIALSTREAGRDIVSRAASSAGQYNVSASSLALIEVPLPPRKEQSAIVTEVERQFSIIDEIERTVDRELKRSFALRQSILSRAFSGRLVASNSSN